MVAPSSKFYVKIWVGFYLNTGKCFFLRDFILRPTERAYVLLKNGTRDFENSPPFERSACFHVTLKLLNVFNNLTFRQIFWKTKTFSKKLEYCFLVDSTKIEKASFP